MMSKFKQIYLPVKPKSCSSFCSMVATDALSPLGFLRVRGVPSSYLHRQCTVCNRHSMSVEWIIFRYVLASSSVLASLVPFSLLRSCVFCLCIRALLGSSSFYCLSLLDILTLCMNYCSSLINTLSASNFASSYPSYGCRIIE